MGKHILQLNFPDCPIEGIFLIDDVSIYDPTMLTTTSIGGTVAPPSPTSPSAYPTGAISPCNQVTVPCGNLQITPPGYTVPSSLSVTNPNFRLILNACTLGMLPPASCSGSCPDIPDGLWNIRYSVSPNDKVYIEYKILRIVEAWNRYISLLCDVGLTPCLPDSELQYQLQSLDTIRNYLLSAKSTVESKHQFEEGLQQYEFAVELMDKITFNRPNC